MRIGLELRLLILLGAVCAFAVLGGLGYVVDESGQQVVIAAIVARHRRRGGESPCSRRATRRHRNGRAPGALGRMRETGGDALAAHRPRGRGLASARAPAD